MPRLLISAAAILIGSVAFSGCSAKPKDGKAATGSGAATRPDDLAVSPASEKDPLAQRVKADIVAVLEAGIAKYNASVRDYTCTMTKQERLTSGGVLQPMQQMDCKFKEGPFSVFMHTVVNAKGARKTLYVEGRHENKMVVVPAVWVPFVTTVKVDVRGPEARASTLRFIDQFGFKRSLESMVDNYRKARRENILKVEVVGDATVDGRKVIVFESRITEAAPSGRFETPRVRVFLDRDRLIPLAVDTWDAAGAERGHYRYTNVRFNVGLTDEDFTPKANKM